MTVAPVRPRWPAPSGLAEACAARGIPLLEDAAQSIGARAGRGGPRVGELGAGGRAVVLSRPRTWARLGDARHGADRRRRPGRAGCACCASTAAERRYHHERVGGNFRLDELQAAFLRVKLPHLPRWTALRRAAADRYRAQPGRPRPAASRLPPDDPGCVWNQFVIRVPGGRRDALADAPGRPGASPPRSTTRCRCTCRPASGSLGHRPGDFPEAERACREVLALPLYPEIGRPPTSTPSLPQAISASCGMAEGC